MLARLLCIVSVDSASFASRPHLGNMDAEFDSLRVRLIRWIGLAWKNIALAWEPIHTRGPGATAPTPRPALRPRRPPGVRSRTGIQRAWAAAAQAV